MAHNPFLQVPDPFEDQRKQQNEVKEEAIEFQRLCFEVFHMNNDGKALYEHIEKKFLLRALFAPSHPQSQNLALYWEGFKEALRGLWAQGNMHRRRINDAIYNRK